MRFLQNFAVLAACAGIATSASAPQQAPLLQHGSDGRKISPALFAELEERARIVDISYCVGLTSLGINKPFKCLSRCEDFPEFELVTTWNTGPLLSDSCGYIALDHGKGRVIVAFRGTYSVANTVVDLSTVPQEYVPYPGEGDDDEVPASGEAVKNILDGIAGHVKRGTEAESEHVNVKCNNCTVHMGFHTAWLHTRKRMLEDLTEQLQLYPDYQLNLVGHSLGGAVAALAGLDLQARGWDPIVTTFGEPRVGNKGLVKFIDERFNLTDTAGKGLNDTKLKYYRVTHIDDPVPLLPLSEWSFAMHAGEIFISKSPLSPDIEDLQLCTGDNDQHCIAGQDSTTAEDQPSEPSQTRRKRDLLYSIEDEVHDMVTEPWGIPSRYKLWELFFAHRDYFWRIGLCAPGGDPTGGGSGKYEGMPNPELR